MHFTASSTYDVHSSSPLQQGGTRPISAQKGRHYSEASAVSGKLDVYLSNHGIALPCGQTRVNFLDTAAPFKVVHDPVCFSPIDERLNKAARPNDHVLGSRGALHSTLRGAWYAKPWAFLRVLQALRWRHIYAMRVNLPRVVLDKHLQNHSCATCDQSDDCDKNNNDVVNASSRTHCFALGPSQCWSAYRASTSFWGGYVNTLMAMLQGR